MKANIGANLRICASCCRIFRRSDASNCPYCGFGHYGARYVLGKSAYREERKQTEWKEVVTNRFLAKLERMLSEKSDVPVVDRSFNGTLDQFLSLRYEAWVAEKSMETSNIANHDDGSGCPKNCLVCVNACFDNAKAEILIGTRPFFVFECLKCPLENAYNFNEERRETIIHDPFTSPPTFWVDGGESAGNCKNFVFNTAAQ